MSGLVYLVLAAMAARVETPTIDEFAHVPAGAEYWTQQRFDIYSRNPPLMKMAMAAPLFAAGVVVPKLPATDDAWTPWRYGIEFMNANAGRYLTLFWIARLVSVLCGLLTGVVLFLWVRDLFGERPAAITAALLFLNPNVLAHAHLATIDVACMFTIVLTLYVLHWAYRRPTAWRMILAGVIWGVALLTKFTAILLLPVILALVVMYRWRSPRRWRRAAIETACVVGMAWLVINAGMGFSGSFEPLSNYRLISTFGNEMQRVFPASMPVPLPADWVKGFDLQKLDTEQGEIGAYSFYLFGQWSERGWWYYNLVAVAVKNPLTLIGLVAACPWFWIQRKRFAPYALAEVLIPLTVIVGSMVLFNRLNIGVRYLLPAFPFMLMATAAVWRGRQRWQNWLAAGVVGTHVAVAVWTYPAYLSYFNETVGGSSHGHRVLLDSNMDWGQDLYRLPAALAKLGVKDRIGLLYFGHVDPHLYGIEYDLLPKEPANGVFAVSVQYLMGGAYVATNADGQMEPIEGDRAAWLQEYVPVARAGSIWIFDTRNKAH